ncbi:Serine/Threonine protein kinase and Signal Transduction Histidine Kinase [Candidatus Magnetomorum sp. HK-1]|nr:Serine/Threonine protein kinase and Signal Transduction Histidine Kinase [Candidatus Magnetomorum sp. HK-1]
MDFYEKAIKQSNKKKLIHDEALSYELAAEFYQLYDKKVSAKLYMQTAHKLYLKWEAYGKAKDLERRFPDLILNEKQSDSDSFSLLDNIDLQTIIRTTNTIATESSENEQFENIIKLFMKTSGAQKGILLLAIDNMWKVKILIDNHSTIDSYSGINKREKNNEIPFSIINYISHSKKMVILNDAKHIGNFTTDPYVIDNQIKSLLCLPLLCKGNINGIIYLENKDMPYIFSKKTCKILKTISVQVSLLVENYIISQQHIENSNNIKFDKPFLNNNIDLKLSKEQSLVTSNHKAEDDDSLLSENHDEEEHSNSLQFYKKDSGFVTTLKKYDFSIKELHVINMIKKGFLSKEIAKKMQLSIETINTYRKRIRKKFGLTNKETNLVYFINRI